MNKPFGRSTGKRPIDTKYHTNSSADGSSKTDLRLESAKAELTNCLFVIAVIFSLFGGMTRATQVLRGSMKCGETFINKTLVVSVTQELDMMICCARKQQQSPMVV